MPCINAEWAIQGDDEPSAFYTASCRLYSSDVIISTMASQITSLRIVYSTVYSGADQRKHQSSASLAFERRIHRWPVNSPHQRPVMRKMFPFDDIIMNIFIKNIVTGNYSNERLILHLNVEINCDFLEHMEFQSLYNHKKKWQTVAGGQCWEKKISFSWWLNHLQLSLYQHSRWVCR